MRERVLQHYEDRNAYEEPNNDDANEYDEAIAYADRNDFNPSRLNDFDTRPLRTTYAKQ